MFLGKEALEKKWNDHEIPPHRRTHEIAEVAQAADYLAVEFQQIRGLIDALERVFPREVQEQAFGAPGVEGDIARIEHLADRVISTYEGMLDWAAALREVRPPAVLASVFEITPQMADRPLRELREFVDRSVAQLDQVPSILADDGTEPIIITLDLTITADDEVMAEYHRRMRRATRKQRWGF